MRLDLTSVGHAALWEHLLNEDTTNEQVAFAFAVPHSPDDCRVVQWIFMQPSDFVFQCDDHVELADAARGRVIKRAHDSNASLVEFHSHRYPGPASFSPSDYAGFREFVPHVWWRLKAKPYFAIVVGPTTADALVWVTSPSSAQALSELRANGASIALTKQSLTTDYVDE